MNFEKFPTSNPEEPEDKDSPEISSSLHADLLTPDVMRDSGEYKDYPNRFDPNDKSVLMRMEQFGLNLTDVAEAIGIRTEKLTPRDLNRELRENLTQDSYDRFIGSATLGSCDVVVGSVFDQNKLLLNPESLDSRIRWNEMMDLIKRYENMEESVGLKLIQRKTDFRESGNLVLGLEAGAHLISSIADIEELKDHNVKIFGLQYGGDTPLATAGGLTEFGHKAVEYLFDHDLIVDLAHSGFNTRQDVMKLAEELERGNLVSYTHGSTVNDIIESWKDKIGERALKQEEVERLAKMGGIIGLGVSKPFFSSTQNVAERIAKIAKLEHGIDSLGIGTDFGGVAPKWLTEIRKPEDLKKLADLLSEEFNMDSRQINKILRSRPKEWIKEAIH